MELLEREKYLNELDHILGTLYDKNGFLVLISGEAGIGKTSLVEKFVKKWEGKLRILWGSCDAFFTPRPLGPVYDIADRMGSNIAELLNSHVSRNEIFSAFIKNLQESAEHNLIVMEDVHWADESTFDLIKFIGRRVNKINSMFIVTFRDDEIGPDHPLRLVLGDISSKSLKRLKLSPLSERTVDILASSKGIKDLFRITGGNPFLVYELLNNEEEGIPSTIKDSITTRISRISSSGKELTELISVIPSRAEFRLLNNLTENNDSLIEECINAGILKSEGDSTSFKHELSRMAVEESLSKTKREAFHKKILQVLLREEDFKYNYSRIIHHALCAGNIEIILEFAPGAAKEASALGAHIQAADHYRNALKFCRNISPGKKLELLEGKSYECYLTGQIDEGIKACEEAAEILKNFNDRMREGENFRRMSRLLWYAGEDLKGEVYLRKAVEILEKEPPGRELALAYSNLSQVYMIREQTHEAVEWGERAIELAGRLGDLEVKAHALNNIGTAAMFAENDSGEEHLKQSLEISLENDFHDHASRAYDNLGAVYIYRRNLLLADKYYSKGIEYCSDKDLYSHELCMTGEVSKIKLYSGDWDEAVERASTTLARDKVPLIDRIIPLCVIGLIRARRNDPGDINFLKEADSLVINSGETGKLVTVKAALAETYWLKSRINEVLPDIESFYFKIKNLSNPWAVGEIAFWLWKAGRLPGIPERIAGPYQLQIRNEWKNAADLWEELKCPYEQALALSDGNEDAMKKAVDIFSRLGASAAANLIKQKLRKTGVRKIPKGPRKTTRKNPGGLTVRELEVLELLRKGLRNSEIGTQLYISPKTVDHHVSAILAKLKIRSRLEAAAFINSDLFSKNRDAV